MQCDDHDSHYSSYFHHYYRVGERAKRLMGGFFIENAPDPAVRERKTVFPSDGRSEDGNRSRNGRKEGFDFVLGMIQFWIKGKEEELHLGGTDRQSLPLWPSNCSLLGALFVVPIGSVGKSKSNKGIR